MSNPFVLRFPSTPSRVMRLSPRKRNLLALSAWSSLSCRFLTVMVAGGLLTLPPTCVAHEASSETLIVLVDRSESIAREPHLQQAVIGNFIGLSRLTDGRLKLAFVFFGETVEVVAGDDGLPAPASAALSTRCLEVLEKPCAGGTPLSEAQTLLNEILSRLGGEPVTVLLLSDGTPNLPLSPELFPLVKNALDGEIADRERDGGREAVEEYLARLNDPNSEELQDLYQIQQPLVVDRCMQLAKATSSFDCRFVSLAFTPGLVALKTIHKKSGGSDADFLEVEPQSALRAIHEANLVSGIMSYPTVEIPPSDRFQVTEEFELAGELKSRALVAAQLNPTPQLEQLATVGFQVNGQRHISGSTVGSLSLAHDSEGRLSTISLIAESADSGKFGFASAKQELTFPGAQIFRWIELPKGLTVVCRPTNVSPDDDLPFDVNEHTDADWLVGLQWQDGSAIQLKAAEVVFKHNETGQHYLVALNPDQRFTNLFSAPPRDLARGTYSVSVHLTLRSGLPMSTTLTNHFTVVGVEEKLKVSVSEQSRSVDRIDFGLLGDEHVEADVSVTLHSDTPHSLGLRVRVIDVKDAAGNPIGDDWITIDGDDVVLPEGESVDVLFRCLLPEHVPDGIVDGVVTGTLEIVNSDTLQTPTIEPLIDGVGDCTTLSQVRFTLKRPRITASAPRAWRELISTTDGPLLRVNANISFPYARQALLYVSTDSRVDRDLAIRISRLHDEEGAVIEDVELQPDEQWIGTTITVKTGEAVSYRMPFSVSEARRRGYGRIIISGQGLQPVVIPFDVGSSGEAGLWIRYVAWLTAGLFTILALIFTKRVLRFAEFCRSDEPREFTNGRVLDVVSFAPVEEGVQLKPIGTGLSIENELDDAEAFDREQVFPITAAPTLHTSDGRKLRITAFEADAQSCWVRVLSGGEYEAQQTSAKRKRIASILFATVGITIATGIRHSAVVIEMVQFTVDALHLS